MTETVMIYIRAILVAGMAERVDDVKDLQSDSPNTNQATFLGLLR